MSFFNFSDNLLQDKHVTFQKKKSVDNLALKKHAKFWFGVQFPLNGLYSLQLPNNAHVNKAI